MPKKSAPKVAASKTPASKTKDPHHVLRQHLLELLVGGHAHAKFEDVIKDLPADLYGKKPANYPHSPWMLLEHLRIAQRDILEFSRTKNHESLKWPDDYWPKTEAPSTPDAWTKSVAQFESDLKAMQNLVADPKTDLFAKIPWGDGQTILREAMLVTDHNSHHLGQLIDVRRLLGAWG
jgi:hypothetical protein